MAMAHGGMAAPGISVNASDTDEAASSQPNTIECCHISGTCITFAIVLPPDSPGGAEARLVQVKPGGAIWRASWRATAEPPPPRA